MRASRPPPPVYIPPPTITDEEIEAERRKALRDAQRRRGRQATILTTGLGDGSTAPTSNKSLLGD